MNPRLILVLLVLIFSAPFLGSLIIVNFTDLVNMKGASHGDMYDPHVKLPDARLHDPYDPERETTLYGSWSMLYLHSGPCDSGCSDQIHAMRQIRLALSRYARNLQRIWLTDIDDERVLREVLTDYEGTRVLHWDDAEFGLDEFELPPVSDPLQSDSLYIIDQDGYLVLRYRPGVEPGGIISDLRRLLKTARID